MLINAGFFEATIPGALSEVPQARAKKPIGQPCVADFE
jgi:hypothetical protein